MAKKSDQSKRLVAADEDEPITSVQFRQTDTDLLLTYMLGQAARAEKIAVADLPQVVRAIRDLDIVIEGGEG
jgi:hypothetical protein